MPTHSLHSYEKTEQGCNQVATRLQPCSPQLVYNMYCNETQTELDLAEQAESQGLCNLSKNQASTQIELQMPDGTATSLYRKPLGYS